MTQWELIQAETEYIMTAADRGQTEDEAREIVRAAERERSAKLREKIKSERAS